MSKVKTKRAEIPKLRQKTTENELPVYFDNKSLKINQNSTQMSDARTVYTTFLYASYIV